MKIADNKQRIGFLIDKSVLATIDEFAKINGISRGGAISVLCMEALSQKKMINTMPEMLKFANLAEQLQTELKNVQQLPEIILPKGE